MAIAPYDGTGIRPCIQLRAIYKLFESMEAATRQDIKGNLRAGQNFGKNM